MGQCVLRDLGFEFEKDPEQNKKDEELLKQKIHVKYPDLYNWEEKITEEDEELSDYRQSLRVSLKNKLGREGRVTTMLNKMVQTDDLEEESMEADFPFNDLDQDVQVESVPRDSYLKEQERLRDQYKMEHPSENEIKRTSNLASSQELREPQRINLFRGAEMEGGNQTPPERAKQANVNRRLFEGNSPGELEKETRPAKAQYKGFENNYFTISRGRSPSPTPHHQNIFTDDEDAGY